MEENNVNETPVENEVVENIADNTSEGENLKAEIEEKIYMEWLQVMLFQQCFQ